MSGGLYLTSVRQTSAGTPDNTTVQMARSDTARPRASLGALKPLVPFAARYKGRIAAAILALVAASGATLTVPVAVRRVVDLGFAHHAPGMGEVGMIDAYFGALIGVVGVLAVASAARYYCVVTLGERVVEAVRANREAEGTAEETVVADLF